MKIIFLNLWYGERSEELMTFIDKQKSSTDIFCFQESSDKLQLQLIKCLNLFDNIAIHKPVNADDDYYQSTFVKRKLKIVNKKNLFGEDNCLGLVTNVKLVNNEKVWLISNVQGLPRPGSKLDTIDRLEQSKKIIGEASDPAELTIIGGDFNLLPESESIKMFEKAGYKNLILEYGIKTTRNKLIWDKYPETKQYFADYVFVSNEIKVKKFEVPDLLISDHLPMILETED